MLSKTITKVICFVLIIFVIRDTESIFEAMAVSLSNPLRSLTIGEAVICRRQSFKDDKYSSARSSKNDSLSDHETTLNTSSVQESVERNWEYYENLRKCYDPDSAILLSQPIPERTKSEESNPDMNKKAPRSFQCAPAISSKRRKLIRRMTSPNFYPTNNFVTERIKRHDSKTSSPYSNSYLRKSMSSVDLHFKFAKRKLMSVKEQDDEDLTLPFEPEEHLVVGIQSPTPALKRMKSIIVKRINVDNFIKDVKREIVFKEEAKDELHGKHHPHF